MTKTLPPVPPESRSPKGPGDATAVDTDTSREQTRDNLKQQGRHGNIAQNTTNQGYQQDR